MKKIIACLMACFAVFAFSACSLNKSGTPDSKGKEPLKIICTNFASYDFVRQIVGDKAEVTMLLKPGAEAHSYEPSPKDIQAIGKSDLFVYTGGDSDEWVDGMLSSIDKSKLKTLKMMDTVKLYEEEMSEGMQEEEHEHHHDDKDHHDEDRTIIMTKTKNITTMTRTTMIRSIIMMTRSTTTMTAKKALKWMSMSGPLPPTLSRS